METSTPPSSTYTSPSVTVNGKEWRLLDNPTVFHGAWFHSGPWISSTWTTSPNPAERKSRLAHRSVGQRRQQLWDMTRSWTSGSSTLTEMFRVPFREFLRWKQWRLQRCLTLKDHRIVTLCNHQSREHHLTVNYLLYQWTSWRPIYSIYYIDTY